MTRLLTSLVPALITAVAIAPYAFTDHFGEAPPSVLILLSPWIAGVYPLLLFFGALGVAVGSVVRKSDNLRASLIGLGVEACCQPVAGGMLILYATATYGRFGLAAWATIFTLIALGTTFLCGWLTTVADVRASRHTQGDSDERR